MSDLKSAFEAFASFGSSKVETELDNAKFGKMCKECSLYDKKFTSTDADLIFNKVKAKGARKLTFAQFKDGAVPEIAAKKGVEASAIEGIIQSSAPKSSGTKAEETRFHDDKEAYTGVYKAGGPTNVDDKSMASHMDRDKKSDARGVVAEKEKPAVNQKPKPSAEKKDGDSKTPPAKASAEGGNNDDDATTPAPAKEEGSTPPPAEAEEAQAEKKTASKKATPPPAAEGSEVTHDLKSAFEAFASFGSSKVETEMENAKIAKMCKECGLLDKKFTVTDVDLAFNKVKAKGARKMTFPEFRDKFLPEMAAKKGVDASVIAEKIQSSAPKSSGTKAEETRFHDDKEAYTGVYKAGGPTNVDDKSMASHMDRDKKSDARGVVAEKEKPAVTQKPKPPAEKSDNASPNKPKVSSDGGNNDDDAAPAKKPEAKKATPPPEGAKSTDLKSAFEAFASFGSSKVETEMDNAKMSKMCKECGLIDKKFSTTDVDLLFNKVKAKGGRKVTFAEFRDKFIPEVATKKGVDAAVITEKIQSSAPASSGTKAEETRFHDDKDNYTGVYKAGGPTNVDDKSMESHMDRNKKSDARGVVKK